MTEEKVSLQGVKVKLSYRGVGSEWAMWAIANLEFGGPKVYIENQFLRAAYAPNIQWRPVFTLIER